MTYVWYFFFAWLYLYLAEVRGFTLLESGFLGALPMLAGAGGAWLGGEVCQRSCDRLGPRLGCRVPVIVGLTGAAVFLTAVVLTPNRYAAVAMLTICYAFLTSTDCIYGQGTLYVAGRYSSPACGVLNTGGNLSGIIGTPLTALLLRSSAGLRRSVPQWCSRCSALLCGSSSASTSRWTAGGIKCNA